MAERRFVPAAGVDWLLPLYDSLQWVLGGHRARRKLIEQAEPLAGLRALDLGCGTGSLVVEAKTLHADLDILGLDPDPKALIRARRKAEKHDVAVRFEQGFADALPYADASLDRVFSSFMFHHLPPDVKRGMLKEVRRVLRPGGSLHLLDFSGSDHGAHGLLARLTHAHDNLHHDTEGRILALLAETGLAEPAEIGRSRTLFGPIAWYRARA